MTPDAGGDRDHDLTTGVTLADFGGRDLLRGHVGDEAVLLVRRGDEVLAIGAFCTHYGGPLEKGIVVDETVRCPWHHACFSLRTGEAVGGPAFDPVTTWRVERDGDAIVVRDRLETRPPTEGPTSGEMPRDVLIIGGGAAGFACAEMLRRHGFEGRITMLSADRDAPYDRPTLSKGFLSGAAGDDGLPLRPEAYYDDNAIDLRLHTRVSSIDLDGRTVVDEDGGSHEFDRLVLATGAEPIRLKLPGADQDHVFTLRTAQDSRRIVAAARDATTAVVVGSGFIGLETAAALTERGLAVNVVTLDEHPLEMVIGRPLGQRVQAQHEDHGTTFHTGTSLSRIDRHTAVLEDGTELAADIVILGVGVRPRVELAEAAGLEVDDGVLVDECLRTAAPGVYAAGDIARWRDPRNGRTLRVEHWVVAERHGQHIARNILHGDRPLPDVPFFWSGHHGMQIRYVGHADDWDEMTIDGDVDALDCMVRFNRGGRTLAIATVGRDVQALRWEAEQEVHPPASPAQ